MAQNSKPKFEKHDTRFVSLMNHPSHTHTIGNMIRKITEAPRETNSAK